MDPDATLTEMRELSAAILASGGEWSMADDLAQRFEALDGWLTARGFLPADWAHPQPVLHDNAPSEEEMAEIEAAAGRAWEAARAEGKIDG